MADYFAILRYLESAPELAAKVFKMMDFPFKMMDFLLRMMDFVLH